MRFARLALLMFAGFFFTALPAQSQQTPPPSVGPVSILTVTGKLHRVMAIGGESTGWSIDLDSAAIVDGNEVLSVQVSFANTARLEKLKDQNVRAAGYVTHRKGTETGDQPILQLTSLKKLKSPTPPPVKSDAHN